VRPNHKEVQQTEAVMPHVIVKLWPGKSEAEKARLAKRIAQDVMEVLDYGEESVSVAMEEIKSSDWAKQVYQPDIKAKWENLYVKPGYSM
jgi:4-oxalocrotonate tautomerase